MILTCPECATSYFVDDSRIPSAGRTVKCANCGARWMATREQPLEIEPQPDDQADIAAEMEAHATEAEAVADDIEIVAPEPPPVVRAPARSAPKHEAQATVIVWGLMAATAAALIVGALVLRADVVRLWPQSSAAYAGLGLPVSGAGLAIEGVAAQPTFQGGRPVLTVSGRVRNLRHRDLSAPALRISLIDAAGHTVSMKIARPIDDSVPAGGQRYFAVAVVDPPSTARDLEVAFDGSGSRSISKNLPPSKPPAAPDATPLPTASPAVTPEHG